MSYPTREDIDAINEAGDLMSKAAKEITALRAEVEEAKAQEDEYMGYVATLGKALRDLSFAAQTTGGVAGRDEGLVAAIDKATSTLSFPGVLKGMNLVAELRSQLSARDAEVRALRAYTVHLTPCRLAMDDYDWQCTCGLSAVLTGEGEGGSQ